MANEQNSSNEQSRPEDVPGSEQVTVCLPYSLVNMIRIEKVMLWVMPVALVVFLARMMVLAFGEVPAVEEQRLPLMLCSAGSLVSLGILLAGYRIIWPATLRGERWAVIVLGILYIPAIAAGLALLGVGIYLVVGLITWPVLEMWVAVPIMATWILILGMALVCNPLDKAAWRFIKLRNRCPLCRKWPFGDVSGPMSKRCETCGAVLRFTLLHEWPARQLAPGTRAYISALILANVVTVLMRLPPGYTGPPYLTFPDTEPWVMGMLCVSTIGLLLWFAKEPLSSICGGIGIASAAGAYLMIIVGIVAHMMAGANTAHAYLPGMILPAGIVAGIAAVRFIRR